MDNPTDNKPEEQWTTVESSSTSAPRNETENVKPEEASQHDEDWAEKSLDEVKEGLKKISNALKYAFNEGKNDPKIKQFGDDVRSAFDKIGDDISDMFKGKE
jgi:hypothetical protein